MTQDKLSEELLLCPFCGGEGRLILPALPLYADYTDLVAAYHDYEAGPGWDYYIGPADNGSLDKAIATNLSEENAKAFADLWNRRAPAREISEAEVEWAARAIDALWSEGQDRGPAFEDTEREYQAHCRSTARAALEAARSPS